MKKSRRNASLSARLSADQWAAIEALAAEKSCTRSEAMRIVVSYGLTIVSISGSLNFGRYATVLEFLAASVGTIIKKDHPDEVELIETTVLQRMEQFHA